MGDKPDEYEVGRACPVCWGVDKPFGDKPTPKYVNVVFWNIDNHPAKGPFPNGTVWTIEEDLEGYCDWLGLFLGEGPDGSDLAIRYGLGVAGDSFLSCTGGIPPGPIFSDHTHENCSVEFTNEVTIPPSNYGGGTGLVT